MRRATGHHRRHRPAPAARPEQADRIVLLEAAAGDLSVDELRVFLAQVDEAAAAAGASPGGWRVRAYVRWSGYARAVSVAIPRQKPKDPFPPEEVPG